MAAEGEIDIIVSGDSTYWQKVGVGGSEAEKELRTQTPKLFVNFQVSNTMNEEISYIERAIQRGVKAIVLAPSNATGLITSVKKAKEAGIPVILINSPLAGDKSYYVSFLSTDNKVGGEACAKALIDGVKATTGQDTGKIAIMSYISGESTEAARVGAFRDYITKNSNLEIVSIKYSHGDVNTAFAQTKQILSANPDLVGIFGANEPTAVGMARAISNANLSGKIIAIGFDGNSELQGFVRDGTLQAIAVQSSYNMGYLGVKTAYDVVFLGKTVAPTMDSGVLMVTQENIDSQEAQNALY